MGELTGHVSVLDVGEGFVLRLSSSSGTFVVLMEFRENYFQINLVKITCNHMHCLWVVVMLPTVL